MAVSFIPPMLEVLEDQGVTVAELDWFVQESIMILMVAVIMTAFWKLVEEGISW